MAEVEKNAGNEEFKAGHFEAALTHYENAINLDQTNIIYYTNKATALTKLQRIDEAINVCNQAITIGRENRGSAENIAKCYNKIATAELSRNRIEAAIEAFRLSYDEKDDPVVTKEIKRLTDLITINPELAKKCKLQGDEYFNSQDYSKAIQSYSDSIKHGPKDPSSYTARAAALLKVAHYESVFEDCDKALKLDPKFYKAVLEKARCYEATKDFQNAYEHYNKVLSLNPGNSDAINGISTMHTKINQKKQAPKLTEAEIQRKMEEPEIRRILQDPMIQSVLHDIQTNPKSVSAHFSNPKVRPALIKLQDSGILS